MSTFKHPVGPQPSKVYWRRRLVVGLAALAIIVVIILIVVRPGASNGAPTTPPPTTASRHAADPQSTTIPTDPTTATGAACKPANITVAAITDKTSYGAEEMPQLSVSITNTGPNACKLDAGTKAQVFTITSGTEVYWKSTDCQTGAIDAEVLLQPGKTVKSQAPIGWDRTRSDPATCSAKRSLVPAGGASYHLATSVDGIASQATKQFILN
ncbi:hypothetical protein G3T36_01915 [Diaminobutyricibacter tongyongensis]|uniref:DUF4232 domain-containing protein n=1 Tax=Leifsonia tongyongensis TaxID=1268043 RepID=A0A6L9XTB3_9MICO|nr:hypothetical protein [Diaminobutyricibacter tongyongensis]NEN04619.1 hypothetical protein [Diaminobutyricibacter tongyongensis]